MKKIFRLLLALVLLTGILIGCDGGGNNIAESEPTPIAGWQKLEARGIEIQLPESFEGGDPLEDLEFLLEKIRMGGPEYEQTAQMIEMNPSLFVIWAFDSEIGSSGFMTNMTITTETIPSSMSLDTYMDAAEGQFPSTFNLTGRELTTLGEYDAGRLEIEFSVGFVLGKELLYVIKDGKTVWVVVYATSAEEYDQRLPIFEQSALSFRIQD